MLMTYLRNVGGSVMFAVPPAILSTLGLSSGQALSIETDGHRLVLQPARPRFTLSELCAQCNPSASWTEEDRAWLDMPSAGREG